MKMNFWVGSSVCARHRHIPFTILVLAALTLGGTKLASGQPITIQVPVTAPWFDTGIDIQPGQRLTIIASGWVVYGNVREYIGNSDGLSPVTDAMNPAGPGHVYSDPVALCLIGKTGGTTGLDTGTPVPASNGRAAGMVGSAYTGVITAGGRLFLGYNDFLDAFTDNSGDFSVQITIDDISPVAGVAIFTAVEISWPSTLNTLYLVQSSTDLQVADWTDFGSLRIGNGSSISVFDTTRNTPKKFYRILSIGSGQ